MTVKEATKALWDYIDSLPLEQRTKAIEYQRGLENEANKTEGGMPVVIRRRLKHNSLLLAQCLEETRELLANRAADLVIQKARL